LAHESLAGNLFVKRARQEAKYIVVDPEFLSLVFSSQKGKYSIQIYEKFTITCLLCCFSGELGGLPPPLFWLFSLRLAQFPIVAACRAPALRPCWPAV